MNTTDKVVTALTPGSIFNRNGLIFRSVSSLASFAGMEEGEILELLNGDMSQMVTCKPSKRGKGVLVALTNQIPVEEGGETPVAQLAVLAGNAIQAEAEVAAAPVVDEEEAEGPLPDAPAVTAETVVGEDLPQI